MEILEGLTFDDVLLEPGLSEVMPVNIQTRFTREIALNNSAGVGTPRADADFTPVI